MSVKTSMTILYEVHGNLYINLTNKCPCACTFCLRQNRDHMEQSDSLWLSHTPSFAEVREEFKRFDMSKYSEVVFCGFGEPTEAFEVLKETAKYIKDNFKLPIRINTNGLGNLINKRDITGELEGLIDVVSISLNTPDADEYYRIVKPCFGRDSYNAMLDFARECTKYVPKVILTTVSTTISPEDEEKCAKICRDLGVTYRIRPFE